MLDIGCDYFTGGGDEAAERKITNATKEAKATRRQKMNKGLRISGVVLDANVENTIQIPKDITTIPTAGKKLNAIMPNPIKKSIPLIYAGLCSKLLLCCTFKSVICSTSPIEFQLGFNVMKGYNKTYAKSNKN